MSENFDPKMMDASADEAREALMSHLSKIDMATVTVIALWYKTWFLKAGYKRLTKVLWDIAKGEGGIK